MVLTCRSLPDSGLTGRTDPFLLIWGSKAALISLKGWTEELLLFREGGWGRKRKSVQVTDDA